MKFEVIKDYPNMEHIIPGCIIEITHIGHDGCRYTYHSIIRYKDNRADTCIFCFNPKDYPEFFREIKEEPKWIDEIVSVKTATTPSTCNIKFDIKPHENGLFTRKDMIEFGSPWHRSGVKKEQDLDEWIEYKSRK